ncbi:unnamed protein product, partial [Closterium sp. NIES-53]
SGEAGRSSNCDWTGCGHAEGGGGPVEGGRPRTCGRSGTKYSRRRAATPERAESPLPGSPAPAAVPTPDSTAPAAPPAPGSSAPAAAPTPGSTAPAAAPAPRSSAPAAAPTLGSTAPAAAPAPGSSAPAAAPTSGSTAPAAAPAPGSSAPAVVPVAPGSVTPGAPLRRVQRRSYHARIWSREGGSQRGGEALVPAPGVRLAPEDPQTPDSAAQYPQAQYPQTQHPQAQHPQAQHPQAQHPQTQHPQAQHPQAQHPQAPHPQQDESRQLPQQAQPGLPETHLRERHPEGGGGLLQQHLARGREAVGGERGSAVGEEAVVGDGLVKSDVLRGQDSARGGVVKLPTRRVRDKAEEDAGNITGGELVRRRIADKSSRSLDPET